MYLIFKNWKLWTLSCQSNGDRFWLIKQLTAYSNNRVLSSGLNQLFWGRNSTLGRRSSATWWLHVRKIQFCYPWSHKIELQRCKAVNLGLFKGLWAFSPPPISHWLTNSLDTSTPVNSCLAAANDSQAGQGFAVPSALDDGLLYSLDPGQPSHCWFFNNLLAIRR